MAERAGRAATGSGTERDGARHDVAIVGDRFMLSARFEAALRDACGDELSCRGLDLPWPDEPMVHGREEDGTAGLLELQGDPGRIVAHVGDAPVLVTHLAPVSADMLERLPALELVAVSRGGPVNVDMTAARERGVKVVNAPGRNASAVAEFTIGAIIAETRNIARGHEALRRGEWRGDLYRADVQHDELSRLVVGVVGYGEIGTRVVRLLRAFGSEILVSDPYRELSDEDRAAGVRHVALDELLAAADVVTLHARVTEETRGFMNADVFARMRPGSVFVNTARGPMVDYAALHDALAGGHLGGAMLETFDVEPLAPDAAIARLPNVTLTPHIAGASLTTVRVAAERVAEEVRRHVAGEPPLNPC